MLLRLIAKTLFIGVTTVIVVVGGVTFGGRAQTHLSRTCPTDGVCSLLAAAGDSFPAYLLDTLSTATYRTLSGARDLFANLFTDTTHPAANFSGAAPETTHDTKSASSPPTPASLNDEIARTPAAPAKTPPPSSPPAPVTERIIERVVEPQYFTTTLSGITEETLAAKLEQLNNSLRSEIYRVQGNNSSNTIQTITQTIAQSQRIDQLSNLAISNATISGSSFSGTISGYLPTSGGTLTGGLSGTTLTLSGALTLSATTTASNGFDISTGCFAQNGTCLGNTAASGVSGAVQFAAAGAFSSDATNLFWDNATKRLGIGTNTPAFALDVNGTIQASSQLKSNLTTGTAPLAVLSTTKVANLNADLLDGFDSSAFGDATAANQTTILSRIGVSGDATTTPGLEPVSLFGGIKGLLGRKYKMQTFTSSGTWTRPAGVDVVEVLLVGGGGGGGGGSGSLGCYGNYGRGGGGGGGGGEIKKRIVPVSGNVTVTIGSGGSGGVAGSPGSSGNATSFGGVSASGGSNGTSANPGQGGAGAGSGGTGGSAGINGATGGNGSVAVIGFNGSIGGGGGGYGGCYGDGYGPKTSGGSGLGFGSGGSSGTGVQGGGGGGGSYGSGGSGGNDPAGNGTAASANTGGGGGGGGGIAGNNTPGIGGAGGSGYVEVYWFE